MTNYLELSDEIRLSCDDINKLPEMIEQFVKRHLDRTIKFSKFRMSFTNYLSGDYETPIGSCSVGSDVVDPPEYSGWVGHIEGESDLYERPVELKGSSYRKICGASELFGQYESAIIRGPRSGTGSGGPRFQYGFKVFLDDFPKLKKLNEDYNGLRSRSILFGKKLAELERQRGHSFIEQDDTIKRLNTTIDIIKHIWIKQCRDNIHKRIVEITATQEYKDAVIVPDEYNFDVDKYDQLSGMFK